MGSGSGLLGPPNVDCTPNVATGALSTAAAAVAGSLLGDAGASVLSVVTGVVVVVVVVVVVTVAVAVTDEDDVDN